MSVLVLGGGLSGLSAAKHLHAAGVEVTVVDKGRGIGGRLATRRGDDDRRFDHGAQYFTVRSPEFAAEVETWKHAGIAAIWADDFPAVAARAPGRNETYPRWCGTEGMAGIGKFLAKDYRVVSNTMIETLTATEQSWIAEAEDGRTFTADDVVVTFPVPQMLSLVDVSRIKLESDLRKKLEAVRYAPCLAVLVSLAEPAKVPKPGGLFCGPEPIAWIADQQAKGISGKPAAILHAGPIFSDEHYRDATEDVIRELLGAAKPYLGDIEQAELHRWKYSLPTVVYPERTAEHVAAFGRRLLFAGDAFGGPRVEGAYLSGRAAASALLGLTSTGTRNGS